jgi:hypothetical protein
MMPVSWVRDRRRKCDAADAIARSQAALSVKESKSLATGGLLTCVALLTLAAVAPVFRRSDPPRWTTYGGVAEAVALAIVCTLALGVGHLGAGAIAAFETRPDFLDLGVLAGVALVAAVIWRGLKAHAMATAG